MISILIFSCTMMLLVYILGEGDLLNSVLLIKEEATEVMVKLTCPRSTSLGILALAGN